MLCNLNPLNECIYFCRYKSLSLRFQRTLLSLLCAVYDSVVCTHSLYVCNYPKQRRVVATLPPTRCLPNYTVRHEYEFQLIYLLLLHISSNYASALEIGAMFVYSPLHNMRYLDIQSIRIFRYLTHTKYYK